MFLKQIKQNTARPFPKSNKIKSLKEAQLILLTHKYMTAHFPDSFQTLQ